MSVWRDVLGRSMAHLRDETVKVLRAAPMGPDPGSTLPLASIRKAEDLRHFVYGCDQDMNGLSKAFLDVDPRGRGRFHGYLNGKVHPGMKLGGRLVDRSGYAGMRTRNRKSLFGTICWDTSPYAFLKLRIRGPPPDTLAARLRYFVNIQTDGPVQSDLYQHRLWVGDSGQWEDILIPFADFALTNAGEMSETQTTMMREKVRTVGISVMLPQGSAESEAAAATEQNHPFDLGIESFECTNINEELPKSPLLANGSATSAVS